MTKNTRRRRTARASAPQYEHAFLRLALECVQPIITEAALKADTRPVLAFPFSYFESVFGKAASLASALDEVRQSRILMVAFPPNDALRRAGIGRTDFVHYHLSHYRVALCSILDRGMELANATLRLGLKSTSLKLDRVEARVPASVAEALRSLHSATVVHSQPRNDFVHRGSVQKIPDLERIGLSEFVQRLAPESSFRIAPSTIAGVVKYVVSTLRPRMVADERQLRRGVDQLFTALLPSFNGELESIGKAAHAELERRRTALNTKSLPMPQSQP
jgi:hypothetical protein